MAVNDRIYGAATCSNLYPQDPDPKDVAKKV